VSIDHREQDHSRTRRVDHDRDHERSTTKVDLLDRGNKSLIDLKQGLSQINGTNTFKVPRSTVPEERTHNSLPL
jgi:hypothetical protein